MNAPHDQPHPNARMLYDHDEFDPPQVVQQGLAKRNQMFCLSVIPKGQKVS